MKKPFSSSADLAKVPVNKEIHDIIMSMGLYKAPGIGGFPPLFFQRNWELVGANFCDFIKGLFKERSNLREANRILIAIIPKRDQPQ